ncbi:MAG TPA: ABC transporter substrate-binding protein [Ramlibacter sp.]|nr:ABC transporter substrate-binding protein [Ramlibacter sp.]
MELRNRMRALACTLLAAGATGAAIAQEPIRIGIVAPLSGVFASYGQQIRNGVDVFLRENGDSVAGRKLQVIYRDNAGPNPEAAKRHAAELIVQDKVDVLAGFPFTPEALAVAPVATQAKKPTFIMLASTSVVSTRSPYIVRTSYTIPQTAFPMGQWAARNKIKRAFVLVADYGPGHDAETWFKKGFTEGGGQIVGEVRVAPNNRDFAPYLQRVREANPDAVFAFLQAGDPVVAFMKGFRERGLDKAGIRVLATEGWADDDTLAAVGDAAIGAISTGFYSSANPSAQNRQFVANYNAISGGRMQPNFVAVGAYDAMRVIAAAIQKQGGKTEPEALMAAIKGFQFDSPRGPLLIDAATRDPVQHIYVRRVEKNAGGKLINWEFDKFTMVKDPGNGPK